MFRPMFLAILGPCLLVQASITSHSSNTENCHEMCSDQRPHPVCGSDAKIYMNSCRLNCLKGVHQVEWKDCNVSCQFVCPHLHKHVCGSDGHFYSSMCELIKKTCSSKGKIAEASELICCQTEHCRTNPKCAELCGDTSNAKCDEFCPKSADRPICASDKKVYASACAIDCKRRPLVKEILWEECKAPCDTFCGRHYDPVCGNNGKTYGNRCELLNASCKEKGKLAEIKKGEC